ncbi:MAG: nuclease-related domain-containing protein, partial [Gemmatimonadaceae bacterium]
MPFEQEVRRLLDRKFPCSTLSNIPVYRPDVPEERLIGYEIDHLLHVTAELNDRLIIIECKEPPITGEHQNQAPTDHGPWNVWREARSRDIKRTQLRNHGGALRAYLQDRAKPVFIEAWLVSQANNTPSREDKRGRHVHFRLFGVPAFCQELVRLEREETILRVEQSALLAELRKGVPVRDMRHPELNNAVAYVQRCRRSIDLELFRAFAPKPHRWAINGTAGMGKSVLLAYALFVFASNRKVVVDTTSQDDERFLADFSKDAVELGLPEYGKRTIYVVSRKEKQLRAIEYFWDHFLKEYASLDDGLSLPFQKPIFRRWSRELLNSDDCNVLLIDEAHDLDPDDQLAVRDWVNVDPEHRYLAIACDRHQKLRLVGSDAVLIEGLNFGRHTDKLKRNYRNPFSVNTAALALMFRWCALSGPKVIPTQAQLRNEFGFDVPEYSTETGGKIVLQNWNDSHPANHWSFTISTFLTCDDAFAQLENSGLAGDQVLWVRFRREEDTFDYEKLLRFTYHNCFTEESFEVVDKYIKGQEYPVVVIEGFPEDADLAEFDRNLTTREQKMWSARRELYLCCSRATTFLYFVVPLSDRADSISNEIGCVVRKVSEPTNPEAVAGRIWQLDFPRSDITRKVDEFRFEAAEDAAATAPTTAPPTEVAVERPVTVRR